MQTVTSCVPNNHEGQQQSISATKIRTTLKEHAGTSRGTLTQLLVDYTTDVQVKVRAALFKPDSIKRSVRRQRAKHLPKNHSLT